MHPQGFLSLDVLKDTHAVDRMRVQTREHRPWVIRPTANNLNQHTPIHTPLMRRTYPIGIIAKSNGPNFSPISLNAGHLGAVSTSSPSMTVLYPVSPAKYAFFPDAGSETDQDAQRVCHRSNGVRLATCCAGVQVRVTEVSTDLDCDDDEDSGEEEEVVVVGRERESIRLSHQSRMWIWDLGIPREER